MIRILVPLVLLCLAVSTCLAAPTPDDVVYLAKRASYCSRAKAGAKGIDKNILIQYQEKSDLSGVAAHDKGYKEVANKKVDKGYTPTLASGKRDMDHTLTVVSAVSDGGYGHVLSPRGQGAIDSAISKASKASKASYYSWVSHKVRLVKTIDAGVDQRKENQDILTKNNPAQAGLLKVSKAQAEEKKLAVSLDRGRGDYDKINQLHEDFSGGIEVNKNNKKLALQGCKRDVDRFNYIMTRMVDVDIESGALGDIEPRYVEVEGFEN